MNTGQGLVIRMDDQRNDSGTVVPVNVMNGHPWTLAKVSLHDRWSLVKRADGWARSGRQTHYTLIVN